jgi:hypothetical protein
MSFTSIKGQTWVEKGILYKHFNLCFIIPFQCLGASEDEIYINLGSMNFSKGCMLLPVYEANYIELLLRPSQDFEKLLRKRIIRDTEMRSFRELESYLAPEKRLNMKNKVTI